MLLPDRGRGVFLLKKQGTSRAFTVSWLPVLIFEQLLLRFYKYIHPSLESFTKAVPLPMNHPYVRNEV